MTARLGRRLLPLAPPALLAASIVHPTEDRDDTTGRHGDAGYTAVPD